MITQAIRNQIAELLNSQSNMFSATLKYATGPISIEKIRRDIKDLQGLVDREYLGRDFHKSKNRSSYWAVVEMLDVAPHVHVGWHFPSLEHGRVLLRRLHEDIWENRYALGGTHDVRAYDRTGYIGGHGWAGYAVKALTTTDHIIFSNSKHIAIRNGNL